VTDKDGFKIDFGALEDNVGDGGGDKFLDCPER